MDDLLQKLKDYSRCLELEDSIPYWEQQKPDLTARIRELDWNRKQKEVTLAGLGEPNFFQKFLGRSEDKKEKLSAQIREITAAQTSAKWELDSLEKQITAAKQELETLRDSRQAYEAARAAAVLTPGQESRLMMEQITAFAPIAMETADRVLEALEAARPWMQKDALSSTVKPENRKMECLYMAQDAARRLCGILSAMPEGVADMGSFFQNPYDYICGVTSEFAQLDRLNSAVEQVLRVKTQLRLLLGE